jgi:hypothetical protein
MPLTKVTYSMIDGAVVNVLDYGADSTGATVSTTAINAAIATGKKLYFPEGTYTTAGGHTIGAKQGIVGDGIQKTIITSTQTTGTCFNLPSYTGSESAVQLGGQRFADFSLIGAASTNPTFGFKLKQQTDVMFDHIEIKGFGYGIGGVRDNVANACTDITILAPRILDCGIGLYAPSYWSGLKVYGGVISGNTWAVIVYDSQDVVLNSVFQCPVTSAGSIFIGGCQGFTVSGYFEGDASTNAFVTIASQKDVDGNATLNGIPIQACYGGIVEKSSFTSGPSIPYGVLVDGASKIAFVGNSAGSGITTALARIVTGVTKCVAIGNHTNPGTVFSFQTATDANTNLVYDDDARLTVAQTQKLSVSGGAPPSAGLAGGLVSVCGADTGHLFMDNDRNNDVAGVYINAFGYQGGLTKFRRTYIQNGKGVSIMEFLPDATNNKIILSSIPTSSAGLSAGTIWNDSGTLKIA